MRGPGEGRGIGLGRERGEEERGAGHRATQETAATGEVEEAGVPRVPVEGEAHR